MRKVLLMLLGIIVFSSCKKNSQSPQAALTTHKWFPEKVSQNGQQVAIPPCEANNFLVFQTNDSGWVDESSCSGNSQPFTYTLSSDNKTMLLNNFYGLGTYKWQVVNLNSSMLEISLSIPITGGPLSNTALNIDYTFVSK